MHGLNIFGKSSQSFDKLIEYLTIVPAQKIGLTDPKFKVSNEFKAYAELGLRKLGTLPKKIEEMRLSLADEGEIKWNMIKQKGNFEIDPSTKLCSFCKQTFPDTKKCLKVDDTVGVMMYLDIKKGGKAHG